MSAVAVPAFECQNCRKLWREEQLLNVGDIPRIFERVSPGEPMPEGECPACGALCHAADAVIL